MVGIGQLITIAAPYPAVLLSPPPTTRTRSKLVHTPLLFINSSRHSLSLQLQQSPQCFKERGGGRNIGGHQIITNASSVTSSSSSSNSSLELGVKEISENYKTWQWKGNSINYFVYPTTSSSNPPLLLVHGFGASIPHWRRNIGVLAQSYTVYAIDLLGFGASDKPTGFAYTMESWAQLLLDFLAEVVQKPTVLVGNSVGSLACVIAASESGSNLVRGLVLLNCSGGMNNKAVVDDWRIKLLLPLLWLIDFLLKQRGIASAFFERVKQRENLRSILLSVYGNKDSVDDDLVEIIKGPADGAGALDAFVSIITGPPGPNPVQLMPKISIPVLVLWGNQDPFTPLDGPAEIYDEKLQSPCSLYLNIKPHGVTQNFIGHHYHGTITSLMCLVHKYRWYLVREAYLEIKSDYITCVPSVLDLRISTLQCYLLLKYSAPCLPIPAKKECILEFLLWRSIS